MSNAFVLLSCVFRAQRPIPPLWRKALDGRLRDFKKRMVFTGFVAGFASSVLTPLAQAEQPIRFDLPVRCTTVGDTANPCRVQNRVDMDASDKRLDGLCQRHTYNNHKGTDFRVATWQDAEKNVPVLAMADGVVVGLRDGMADRMVRDAKSLAAIKGVECGNGVMVDHGIHGGKQFRTQYCHFKKGSVAVTKGMKVKRGVRLGAIGLSGHTQFPHVHVSIWQGKKVVDPYSGQLMHSNICDVKGANGERSFFTPKALAALSQFESPLMKAGFTSRIVKQADIVGAVPPGQKSKSLPKPKPGTPLIYYAFMMNLNKGDQLRLTITSQNEIWNRTTTKPMPVDRPSHAVYLGRRSGGKEGKSYEGVVELLRDGAVIFKSTPQSISF